MARVLFLQDNGINESLALTELSAFLKARGHTTTLFLEQEEPALDRVLAHWKPDIAVIPCSVAAHSTALRLAARLKEAVPGCTTILGGTHATFDPELALKAQVDAVCVGEAEMAVADAADRLDNGEGLDDVPNLAIDNDGTLVKNPLAPLVEDLDALPLPDRNLYFRYPFMARFPWKKFMTGRGCVHSCAFCWNPGVRDMYEAGSSFTRRKSPARAVEEVVSVLAQHPLDTVHFSDDLFTYRPGWLEEFAPLYRNRVGLPFTCNSSIELVTPRAVNALAAAGCRGVAIGLETGNETLRTQILKKTVTNNDVRKAAALIKNAGMELTTFNMLACPGETLEDAFSTIALNREIGADHIRLSLAVPIPFTDWERQAQEEGLLQADYAGRRVEGLSRPEVAFASEDVLAFRNLYYLFRPLVHHPWLEPLVRRLIRMPSTRPLEILRLLVAYEEKRIYHLGWKEGLRFFSHVGDPRNRTTNYVTLI
jgi:anaerobic magnesium-protoporphyrin IX monomethyl ester cyclase